MTPADAEVIVKLAKERAALVKRMREALLREDYAEALKLARRVAGIEEEQNEKTHS
jgi:hypothetical protein